MSTFDHLALNVDATGHIQATPTPYSVDEILAAGYEAAGQPPPLTYGNMSAGLPPAVHVPPPVLPKPSPDERGYQMWVDTAAVMIGRQRMALDYYARGGNDGGKRAREAMEARHGA